MGVEGFLYLLHLLDGRLFGIALHAGVDGGVDFQAVLIKVIAVLLAPVLQMVLHGFAEIERLSVVVVLNAIVQFDGLDLQRVVGLLCEVAMLEHVVQHYIAAVQRIFGIDARIIISGGFQQSYQDGGLVGCQVLRSRAEVGLCSCLDAKSVGTEVNGIGIHGEYLLLVEE